MREYISKEKIQEKIIELGKKITADYNGEEIVVVTVLKGGFVFCSDLVRQINLPMRLEFISASSYGDDTESSGNVNIRLDLGRSIEGKHVLIIEDIIDTGKTLYHILELLKHRNPKSLKLASLLFKPDRLIHPIDIHYLGFTIENKFVIGYGLDYAGNYRNLPYLAIYDED
jgi:hypoxanthine phosphoribosyltransferase